MAVTLAYARGVEAEINRLLGEGNIAGARLQLGNIAGSDNGQGVINVFNRMKDVIRAAEIAAAEAREPETSGPTEIRGPDQPIPPGEPEFTGSWADFGPSGGGSGGGGGGSDDYYKKLYEEQQRQARERASAYVKSLLEQYGLGSLAGRVDELVRQFGPIPEVIMGKLRETGEYKQRFKGLLGLQQKGVTDVRNEAEYLTLESQYRQVFRDSNLTSYLGTPGSQQEYDAIAKIVGDFSLSVNEVQERVVDAQRVVAETPKEVRDSLQQFYNIDPAMLTQYVLDPQNTATEIQRRANAAIVGGYATRAGLEFGAGVSERIGEFLGGERNLRGTQIEPQLTEIADIQKSTERLAEIEQSDLSDETTALAALDLDEGARRRVRTLQSRERARFGGRAGLTSRSLSDVSGI